MALSSRFASFPQGQKVSSMMLLVAFYVMACAGPAMANGRSSNTKPRLQSRLVQALKEKGGFTAAATFLGAVDLNRVLPESRTILVPMDEVVTESGLQVSTFNTALPVLQYHVITKRLAFRDLQQLPEGETLETLLPNNTVIITSNSPSNFSVDDVPLSHGNLFLASSTAVHGIEGVLSFAIYGKREKLPNSQPTASPATSPVDGGEPAKQPIPPAAAGKGSSSTGNGTEPSPSHAAMGNQTQSSPSPANPTGVVSFNSSISPPITPATHVSPNVLSSSSFAPVSLPTPTGPQHALPPEFNPVDCDANRVCSVFLSSSHHLKPLLVNDILSAVLLEAVLLLAGVLATPRLTLMLYVVMLVLMAAAPTNSGEMNVDVSEVLRNKKGFGYAATYLQALDMHKVLPNRSTVLVTMDQLSFEDLQKLPIETTLATLLPSSLLLIKSNAASNFTVNDVLLSHPDITAQQSMVFLESGTSVLQIVRQHIRASPTCTPHLFPLTSSSPGPFAAPLPISQAVSAFKGLNVNYLLMILACTSWFILTFPALIQSESPSQVTC